jgi:hypothetical protein
MAETDGFLPIYAADLLGSLIADFKIIKTL